MNRSEISEIKKQLNLRDCNLQGIAGCYVNGDKDIIKTWNRKFLTLEENDIYKYMEIIKKSLSGALGKTLYNISPSDSALSILHSIKEDFIAESYLMDLYDRIIGNYEHVGNYLILSVYGVYDIPGKTKDGIEMEDASDEVYRYTIHCICPVELSKPGLGYNAEKQEFTHIDRDWILMYPEVAILYPAFNDRSEDKNAALYYAKSLDDSKQEFVWNALRASLGHTPTEDQDIYREIIEEALGHDRNIADIVAIEDATRERAKLLKDKQEDKIDIDDIRTILADAGIASKEDIESIYAKVTGSIRTQIGIQNVVNNAKTTIKTGCGTITFGAGDRIRVGEGEHDGRHCLILELEPNEIYTVNGYEIRAGGSKESE